MAGLLLTIVLGAIFALADFAQRSVPRDEALAFSIRDAQVALDRATRELRQAYVFSASPTAIRMDVRVPVMGSTGSSRRVVFDCNQAHPKISALRQCARWVVSGTGSYGPKAVVIPDVVNAKFTYEPPTSPRYARLTVNVPAAGDRVKGYAHSVFLDDGFYMRNLDLDAPLPTGGGDDDDDDDD